MKNSGPRLSASTSPLLELELISLKNKEYPARGQKIK